MRSSIRGVAAFCAVLIGVNNAAAQNLSGTPGSNTFQANSTLGRIGEMEAKYGLSSKHRYFSQADGLALQEVVRLAIENNGDLRVARLEIDRAKARLTQARSRPNPTLDLERSSGRLTGDPGEDSFVAGISVPLEVFGQRRSRREAAAVEINVREAELVVLKRDLVARVIASYLDALALIKELDTLEQLRALDMETARFVQIRVNQGETAPLELSLIQVEVERLRSRQHLVEGGIQAAISNLKFYAGLEQTDALRLRDDLASSIFSSPPVDITTAIQFAERNRPEMHLAELEVRSAEARSRLVSSESKPELNIRTTYMQGSSMIDDPRGQFFNQDRSLTFGLSVQIPVFDRKAGVKAEAAIVVQQAEEKKVLVQRRVRNEVVIAFQRLDAAQKAVSSFETIVMPRSIQNVETTKKIYELGQIKITDLITEQKRLLDSTQDLTEALRDRYKAEAELFSALGMTFEK